MNIEISYESKRECGFRKPSKDGVGIYLRGFGHGEACDRLPFPLHACPCCGMGFSFARNFTWIDPIVIFDTHLQPACTHFWDDGLGCGFKEDRFHHHDRCWMCNPEIVGHRAGLIWIGEKFYPTPHHFVREANTMGISRKIAALPNGFNVGEHVIYLAHDKAIEVKDDKGKITFQAGVFMTFRPNLVELVIDDPDRVPDKAIALLKKLGEDKCKIIKVIPDNEEEPVGLWSEE